MSPPTQCLLLQTQILLIPSDSCLTCLLRCPADAASSWLSSTVLAMKPYVGQGNYINYPDPLLAATSAWQYDYYGDNLAEYIAVKTR